MAADLTPGAWVRATTSTGKVFEGIVSIYDQKASTLIISVDDTTVLINTSFVDNLESQPPKQTTGLPHTAINMEELLKKEEKACAQRQKEAGKIGLGVTPEGQLMFDVLDKTLPCRWERDTIIVLNDVYVSAPYGPQDCKGPNPRLTRVQKMVEANQGKLRAAGVASPKQS